MLETVGLLERQLYEVNCVSKVVLEGPVYVISSVKDTRARILITFHYYVIIVILQ